MCLSSSQTAGLHPTAEQIEMFAYHLPEATLSNLVVSTNISSSTGSPTHSGWFCQMSIPLWVGCVPPEQPEFFEALIRVHELIMNCRLCVNFVVPKLNSDRLERRSCPGEGLLHACSGLVFSFWLTVWRLLFQDIFVSLSQVDGMFFVCNIEDFKFLADMIQHIPLNLRSRYIFCTAPINKKQPFVCTSFLKVRMGRRWEMNACVCFCWAGLREI